MVMAKPSLQISLVAIAICLCGIAIVSTVQIAIATYLLRSGITEGTVIANEALIIFSSSLSLAYLVFQLFFLKRHQKTRSNETGSRNQTLIILCAIALAWTAAFVYGSVFAVRSTINQRPPPNYLRENDISYYKIQLASAAASLTALAIVCTLFCLIKFSAQKFTTHQRAKYNDLDHHEDMDKLYRELSAEVSTMHRGVPTPSSKSLLLQTRQTSYPYAQKSWPSDFDWDVSFSMQSGKQSSDSQTAYSFIPSPIVESASPSVKNHFHSFSASTPSSYPINAALQSSRRRSSSAPQFWKKPNSPKVPRNYRPQTYQGPLIDAKPARPGSRPSMPPAAFWQYAADQQTRGISPGRLQSWQIDRDKRRRESSISRYPVVPTIPHKAAFRMEDKAQRMTRTPNKAPYESLIGSTIDDDYFNFLDSNVVGEQMRDAKEPRVERRLEDNSATEARRSRLVKKRPLDNEIYPVRKQK